MSNDHKENLVHKINKSALITVLGVVLLFSSAVGVTLLAPRYIDPSWTQPSNPYQVQMYEVVDPNLYISSSSKDTSPKQTLYHLKQNYTLLAFQETETQHIIAPPELEKYITRQDEKPLKLTSKLMLLRKSPEKNRAKNKKENYETLELYAPDGEEAFSLAQSDVSLENWIDQGSFNIMDESSPPYLSDVGVVYVLNPLEYRISHYKFGHQEGWQYDPKGKAILNLEELKNHQLHFLSRKELISMGEHIYAIEGCWYCHTDQTRTLVQDVVLNGSAEYPAPPSSANEYIYQKITFPGTRRIGPDISRVGVKRPNRDWHIGHFWSPKSASPGSIMPAFQHFFDNDPRGTGINKIGIANYKFEAIFQYLMTKGTRITPPTQAWWLGKDPIKTKEIIEGMRVLP